MEIDFRDEALDALSLCSGASGRPLEQTVLDALAFYDWARRQVVAGRSIAVVDGNKVTEVLTDFNMERRRRKQEQP